MRGDRSGWVQHECGSSASPQVHVHLRAEVDATEQPLILPRVLQARGRDPHRHGLACRKWSCLVERSHGPTLTDRGQPMMRLSTAWCLARAARGARTDHCPVPRTPRPRSYGPTPPLGRLQRTPPAHTTRTNQLDGYSGLHEPARTARPHQLDGCSALDGRPASVAPDGPFQHGATGHGTRLIIAV